MKAVDVRRCPRVRLPHLPALLGQQHPSFRAGVDIVSLNVTVTDAANHYITDLEGPEFIVFEDGIKQNVTFFSRRQSPIALSLLLDSSASMEEHLGTLQQAASNFVHRLKSNDIAQVIDFDSRVEIRQAFTGNQGELDTAISQIVAGGSTSLHNAIYIALKELRKVRAVNEEDVRRQALIVFSDGEDTSSLVSFDEVLDLAKRSETRSTRSRCAASTPRQGLQGSRVRDADARAGDRRAGVLPGQDRRSRRRVRADRGRTRQPVHAGLHIGESPSRRCMAADRGPGITTEHHPADEKGVLRPDSPLNLLPLDPVRRRGRRIRDSFRERQPSVGRAATTLLLLGVLAHTFVIGMQTMEVRHVPFSNTSTAVSSFVWMLALSYLYIEVTTDERAMGVFILPIVVGL